MGDTKDLLARAQAANAEYLRAVAEADALRAGRNAAILAAADRFGVRELSPVLGISASRLHEIVRAARAAARRPPAWSA